MHDLVGRPTEIRSCRNRVRAGVTFSAALLGTIKFNTKHSGARLIASPDLGTSTIRDNAPGFLDFEYMKLPLLGPAQGFSLARVWSH